MAEDEDDRDQLERILEAVEKMREQLNICHIEAVALRDLLIARGVITKQQMKDARAETIRTFLTASPSPYGEQ